MKRANKRLKCKIEVGKNNENKIVNDENKSENQNKIDNLEDPEGNFKEIFSKIMPISEKETIEINSARKESTNTPINFRNTRNNSSSQIVFNNFFKMESTSKKADKLQKIININSKIEDLNLNSNIQVF